MPMKQIYCSNATNKILEEKMEEAINRYSENYRIEKALVKAICRQESQMYPYAVRYEPQLRRAKWYLATIPEEYKTNKMAYCSMGAMQVLYGIAKINGYKGDPEGLFIIDNAINYGCKHLSNIIDARYYWADVVSTYNQGSPRRYTTGKNKGKFKNQDYVDSVYKYYRLYGGVVNMHLDEKRRGK